MLMWVCLLLGKPDTYILLIDICCTHRVSRNHKTMEFPLLQAPTALISILKMGIFVLELLSWSSMLLFTIQFSRTENQIVSSI